MVSIGRAHPVHTERNVLPNRDWLVIPLLSILSFVGILGITEVAARLIFPKSKTTLNNCLVLDDAVNGARGVPNSVCVSKGPEDAKPIVYRFNNAGYRTGEEPGPKPSGVYRVVMIGSSIVMGYHAAWDDTFMALLGKRLSKATGHPVDVYNEGLFRGTVPRATLHFQEILSLHPDLIMLPITPWEIEKAGNLLPAADPKVTSSMIKNQLLTGKWMQLIGMMANESRSILLGDYLFFSNRTEYLKQALAPGSPTEYLRSTPSTTWQSKLDQFDREFSSLADHASAAGIPLLVTVIPRRAQAAMISQGSWPAGFDPYLFGEQMRAMAQRHNGIYVDILQDYKQAPDPEAGYLLMDGHPNSEGHAMIADFLTRELSRAAVPRLRPFRNASQ